MIQLPISTRLAALGRCEVFSRIAPSALAVLAEIVEAESLEAGEELFLRGEASDRVYVVVSGALAIRVPGREDPVRTLRAGALLGEYGMFAGHVRTASASAVEATTLLTLGYDRFRAFLVEFPEATLALLATAVARLVEAERS